MAPVHCQLLRGCLVSNDPDPHDTTFRVESAGGVTTMRVDGDLDLSTLAALSGALQRAVAMTVDEMVVDLSTCRFLCSRSLGLIEASAVELQDRRARLVVRDQPPSFDLITATVGVDVFDPVER